MNAGTVPFHGGSPGAQPGLVAAPLQGGGTVLPIRLYVKNVPVRTIGAPMDIATIAVPAGITRFGVVIGSSVNGGGGQILAETAAGSLGAASFKMWDGPNATGNAITGVSGGPSQAGAMVGLPGAGAGFVSTASTIYINQSVNSAFAGTCSFYVTIFPLP